MSCQHDYTGVEPAIAQLADLFHLLGDPTRLRIVLACLPAPIAVSDIATTLDLSSSLVSHHLRLLRAARIVKSERQGKQVFYSAADAHITGVLNDMLEHIAEPSTGTEA
ncbi:DNA-binding transcriptional regulator, ArsR family [Duganella sacchari]|uniref:DNA-binding transcriptional regulator, ArsR family n=1 Tax=Duganella sacchari TaxID=551987 RepID=A0A1M7Q6R5_9BURK|nr:MULTISPECIES: metalloregulator ArsR/SmtB family transcription factor [Duganella]MYM29912.1 metalloregulator ArsR/SmtB family transcription factor [Duganella sp. CY15W]SHN26208.1 DNA-binding transcriptional regulator, ArsR family [Duganella sacchari]